MDKVYFLWLQKIASLSDKFNAKVYDKIKQCIKNSRTHITYNNGPSQLPGTKPKRTTYKY